MVTFKNHGFKDRPGSVTGAALGRAIVLTAILTFGAILAVWWLRTHQAAAPPHEAAQLQGDPILPINTNPATLAPAPNRFGIVPGALTNLSELAATNAVVAEVTGLGENGKRTRRKRPKPGSYPKRLMDLQMRLLEEGKDPRAYDTNIMPADFVLTNQPPPRIEGYEPVSFSLLAGYEFDLHPEIVQSSNLTAATERSFAQVPLEVRALSGQEIAVSGFLLPMRMEDGFAVEFLLMRDQTLCCFGRVPRINEWISVTASGRGAQPRMDVPITVCGTFTVSDQREQGTLIGLYKMEADKIIEAD